MAKITAMLPEPGMLCQWGIDIERPQGSNERNADCAGAGLGNSFIRLDERRGTSHEVLGFHCGYFREPFYTSPGFRLLIPGEHR
jgi:hypothetical protein